MRSAHLCAVVGFAALAAPAFAQYNPVNTRAGLGGNDHVDWNQLGPTTTLVPDGATATSTVNGIVATLTTANGVGVERRDQNPANTSNSTGWNGNLGAGDAALWTRGNGPLTIMFSNLGSQAITGVGAQFQTNTAGAFSADLELLDATQNVLRAFTFTGTSVFFTADNTARFMGATSTLGDIQGVRFVGKTDANGQNFDVNSFVINRLELRVASTGGDPVPEPSEWAAMGVLGLALGGLVLRRRRA